MSIQLDKKKSQLFMALGQYKTHSFIFFGIYDDKNKVTHLIAKAGKFFVRTKDDSSCGVLANFLFYRHKSQLEAEKLRSKNENVPCSYHAYDISYTQYVEWIKLIEGLQTASNPFKCYKPICTNEDSVTLKLTSTRIFEHVENRAEINKSVSSLNLYNTCRHTAIRLAEEVLKKGFSSTVSSHFFVTLPCKTMLNKGLPSSEIPFYVLPAPPNACSDLPDNKKKLAEQFYRRMEHLIVLNPNSIETQNKFNLLKIFYKELIGTKREQSLDDLLCCIHDWKETNKECLSTLRKTYFWDSFISRQSASMGLIEKVEQDLRSQLLLLL